MATHIYTSVAVNYLPKARVLAESIKKFHSDWTIHVVLCDAKPEWFSLESEPFDSLLTLEELDIPDLPAWTFKHSLVELSTGVKGFALSKILALPGCTEVLYFDPDIVVLSPLSPLVSEFENASVLLTPHLSEPEHDREAIVDNELSTLQHGIYNLGFIGVKNSEVGQQFASWWRDRLHDFCYDNIPGGLFTDQRWADLVPAYFPDHKVLRDPVYNVATWNLTHRIVSGSLRDGLLVNGQPLAFYHFSGFDNGAQEGMLNKYGRAMPALFELRDWYLSACEGHGQQVLSQVPWAYDFFDNGQPILPAHRKQYRETPELPLRFPHPFATEGEESYFHWLQRYDGGRPLFLDAPLSLPSHLAPQYQIYLLGASADAEYIAESACRLFESSFRQSQIFLVTSQDLELSFPLPKGMEVLRFNATRYQDLFAAVLQGRNEMDLIVVRAGVMPPKNWDLRLAWSAARYRSALTVSPLDRRVLDPAGMFSGMSGEKLDDLCYWLRQPDDPETASFLEDCVYLRTAALREMLPSQAPVRLWDIAVQAARFRYSHRLATHLCCGWICPRRTGNIEQLDVTLAATIRKLRDAIHSYALLPQAVPVPVVSKTMTSPTLHITHSWGGGVEQWLGDYSKADSAHENLVLKSFGPRGAYGEELRLYRYGGDEPELLRTWPLEPAIPATAVFHKAYERVLSEIDAEFCFGRVLVSSLIGHALDCLRLKQPTAMVCHDYYPFCSAINITFGEVCQSCEKPRLQACLEENIHNSSFPNVSAGEWLVIRTEFLRAVKKRETTFVAPSPSVKENYLRLMPELASSFVVIPHGAGDGSQLFVDLQFLPDRPLRVLVTGSLAVHKGRLLLEAILPDLLQFADITLLGCHDFADTFTGHARIHVIPRYKHAELRKWTAELEPEVNLLLSVVPETFSYTLREMQEMGVPSLATRLGSFADWIEDGVTGFLCAPEPKAILQLLRQFADDKIPLERIHQNLKTFQRRSAADMVRDYEKLNPTQYDSERYFGGPKSPEPFWEKRLQLYWRTAKHDFSEANSFAAAPLGTQRQFLRLYFPRQKEQPWHELRLDLSAQSGFFLLYRVALLNFQDETVWNWNGETPWEAIQSSQILPIETVKEQSGSLLYLASDDPWLILPLPEALLEKAERGGSIIVEFAFGANTDYMPDLVSAVQSGKAAWRDTLQDHLSRSQDELLEKDKRIRELEERKTKFTESEQNLRRQVHRWQDEAVKAQQVNADLQSSFSWQMTKPVRDFIALGRKLLR